MLEGARHRTAPRTVDLYDVFCAILYLLKSSCTWRVRHYFDHWTAGAADGFSLLGQALKIWPSKSVPGMGVTILQ